MYYAYLTLPTSRAIYPLPTTLLDIPAPHLCYYAPSTAPPPSDLSQTFADYILDLLHLLDLYSYQTCLLL